MAAENEGDEALRVEGSLVDFKRDVWPIIQTHCIECHSPDEAKNDFRMDASETVMDYVEAGDIESSSLWVDYMVTDDPDMRMPPLDHSTLTGPELATFRLWIEEGANWPEELPTESTEEVTVEQLQAIPASMPARVWSFQGLFHPASVHFPVALLMVSGLMVLLSFLSRKSFEPVAFHCLWIGALGAIASCLTGWSYAQHEGYGAGFSMDLNNSAIDRHRWMGIGTAVVAVILMPMAISVRKNGDIGMRLMWLLGSLILMVAVSFAGYQGGELTYGEDHYQEEFARLFPEYDQSEAIVEEPASREESNTEEESEPSTPSGETETAVSTADDNRDESSGESAAETTVDSDSTPPADESADIEDSATDSPEPTTSQEATTPAAETSSDQPAEPEAPTALDQSPTTDEKPATNTESEATESESEATESETNDQAETTAGQPD